MGGQRSEERQANRRCLWLWFQIEKRIEVRMDVTRKRTCGEEPVEAVINFFRDRASEMELSLLLSLFSIHLCPDEWQGMENKDAEDWDDWRGCEDGVGDVLDGRRWSRGRNGLVFNQRKRRSRVPLPDWRVSSLKLWPGGAGVFLCRGTRDKGVR